MLNKMADIAYLAGATLELSLPIMYRSHMPLQ